MPPTIVGGEAATKKLDGLASEPTSPEFAFGALQR
jgi:hypothetical protein